MDKSVLNPSQILLVYFCSSTTIPNISKKQNFCYGSHNQKRILAITDCNTGHTDSIRYTNCYLWIGLLNYAELRVLGRLCLRQIHFSHVPLETVI